MGQITSTKPSLTAADIQAAVAAALTAHSFDTPLTVADAQAAAAAALTEHSFDTPLTAAEVQTAAEAALGASPPSPIASIQRGSLSIGVSDSSATATISSVDTSKTMINLLAAISQARKGGSTVDESTFGSLRLALSNETTIVVYKSGDVFGASSAGTLTVGYEASEYA